MKSSTPGLNDALVSSSFTFWYVADLWYNGSRRLADVPVTVTALTDDDSRAVKSQGTCTITWSDQFGESIMPNEPEDLFSPFGSELAVYAIVETGLGNRERIPMGWYQITDVPDMRDHTMFWEPEQRVISTGTVLQLSLMDRLIQVQRDEFGAPGAPSSLASVWGEIGTLTGLPLVRSITDAAITRSVVYKEDRLQAVLDLADIIGGVPYMDPNGALTMRTKNWPAPVDTMRRGDGGSIINIGRGMSPDGVYNAVIFRGQSNDQTTVWASTEIDSGAMRTRNGDGSRSPAHRRPTFRSNEFITTYEQAKAYTETELVRVSTLRSIRWPITETWNPLREVGDVVYVVDEFENSVLCRIVSISRSGGPTQEVVVVHG